MLWSDGTHVDKAGRNKVQVVTASWGVYILHMQCLMSRLLAVFLLT